jgi:hypothetical protein
MDGQTTGGQGMGGCRGPQVGGRVRENGASVLTREGVVGKCAVQWSDCKVRAEMDEERAATAFGTQMPAGRWRCVRACMRACVCVPERVWGAGS